MRFRPTPPAPPPDLLARFGEPEHVFGPNVRFRMASGVLGLVLMGMGLGSFVAGAALSRDQGSPGGLMLMFLGGGLMAVGAGATVLPWRGRPTWVVVCPRGLARARGDDWESIAWADVVRFDGADLARGVVAVRQCRIITADGTEWGFLADWVADYPTLVAVLRDRVNSRVLPGTGH